jgi:AmiR/NasT family two-component response regulator
LRSDIGERGMRLPFRVMVVEDEPVVAVGVVAMIQEAGHEVVGVARSGEEALDMAAEKSVQIAVVDVKLPGINGIETARQLVERHNTAVIILTAYADPEFVKGAAAAGAFTYLLKPVAKEVLIPNLEMAAARANELGELRKEAHDLKTSLEVRKLSERAKHILMERLSLNEGDAFAHLKQKCRNQNKTLRQASEEILAAEEAFLGEVDKDPPKKSRSETVA